MYESLLKHTAEYQKISASLATPGPAALFGLPPAGRALLYAALQKDLGRVLCIVTPGEAEATHFADDLKALGLTAAVFPPRDFMLRPVEGAGREYEYRRLSVLGALAGGRLNAVCVPAEALLQYTVPRAEFQKNTLTLKPGMVYNREALVERLFSAGYVRRSQVDGPGQFSVRGDIVDIYAPDMHQPARIEYWDDEIDSLASFDLLTQRRDGSLEKIYLSPAREVLFGSAADTAEALRAAQKKARGKHRTALEKAMEADLSQLDSGLMPEAMDKYYGLRYPAPATLLDHLDSPLFVLDEVGGIRDAQKATEFRRGEELTGLLEEGVLCPGLDVLYQTMDDLVFAAQKQSTLLCENFLRGMNEFQLKDLINAEAFAAPNWGGDLASLREDLDPLIAQGYAVTLFAGTPKGAAALTRDLADKGYSVSMSRDVRPAKGLVQVLPGHLTAGCTFPFARMAVISSRRHGLDEAAEAKKRKKNKNALSSLSDIKPGDYVVHQSHGIGMYAGIQRLEVQGAIKDYLKIQYSGSDVLYVPVTQLDLLSRYTAPGDEEKVKLAKLGGTEWQRTRAKVKKATEEMAQELIELYARRRQAPGYAFPPDGDWQSDFEARFEYDETDDQLNATSEIKKDMERSYPMDRLLCGDVGVGKTEVALRAAFKCVMGGKQCAILAPTTLLAQVDSAVGGKTGLDLPEGKNLLGCFYQPRMVLADTVCLATLPWRQLACGMAEVIKYGCIADEELLTRLEQQEPDWPRIIRRCLACKAALVAQDERDEGPRRLLNFGHTFGHAMEALGGGRYTHGECVAAGMMEMLRWQTAHGSDQTAMLARLGTLLERYDLPRRLDLPEAAWRQDLLRDKKRSGGEMTIAVLERPGHGVLWSVTPEELLEETRWM